MEAIVLSITPKDDAVFLVDINLVRIYIHFLKDL